MFVDEARVCARSAANIVRSADFGEEETASSTWPWSTSTGRRGRASFAPSPLEARRSLRHPASIAAFDIARARLRSRCARRRGRAPLARSPRCRDVLIDRSGAVEIADFGIARAAEIERRTDARQLKGKLGYMSPEQVVGRDLDARSDIFTLGIVLAKMLIRPLFSGGQRKLDVLIRIRDADLSAIDRAGARVPEDVRAVLFRAVSPGTPAFFGPTRPPSRMRS